MDYPIVKFEDLKRGFPLVGMEPSSVATFAAGRTNGGHGAGSVGTPPVASKPKSFHGAIQFKTTTSTMHLFQIAEEIIQLLASDPNAILNVTLEINAEFPDGAPDQIKRSVSENATSTSLGLNRGCGSTEMKATKHSLHDTCNVKCLDTHAHFVFSSFVGSTMVGIIRNSQNRRERFWSDLWTHRHQYEKLCFQWLGVLLMLMEEDFSERNS